MGHGFAKDVDLAGVVGAVGRAFGEVEVEGGSQRGGGFDEQSYLSHGEAAVVHGAGGHAGDAVEVELEANGAGTKPAEGILKEAIARVGAEGEELIEAEVVQIGRSTKLLQNVLVVVGFI